MTNLWLFRDKIAPLCGTVFLALTVPPKKGRLTPMLNHGMFCISSKVASLLFSPSFLLKISYQGSMGVGQFPSSSVPRCSFNLLGLR